MSDENDTDKPHEPSQRKLDEARKKGEIPRSQDVFTATAYAGLILAAISLGPAALSRAGTALSVLLGQADRLALGMTQDNPTLLGGLFIRVAMSLSPFLAIPALATVLALIATRGLTVAPTKLAPKLSRISLVSNAKNKFGRSGLFEFSKSFAKLAIYSVILTVFIVRNLSDISASVRTHPDFVVTLLLKLSLQFLFVVLAIAAAIGAIDFLWQRAEHLRKHRMSDKDVKEEHKQAEGDPHMKSERRARGQHIAMNQMMADVPTADVILTNPTHVAVALKWDRKPGTAPVCVAKGADEIAARIREKAAEHGVPIHRDPPTARALWATTDIGVEIDPTHYRAVAAAIRFADNMRQKAGRSWR